MAVGEGEMTRAVPRGARPSRPSRRRGRGRRRAAARRRPRHRWAGDHRAHRRRRRSPSSRTTAADAWPAPVARPSATRTDRRRRCRRHPTGRATLRQRGETFLHPAGDRPEHTGGVEGRGQGRSDGRHRGKGHERSRLPATVGWSGQRARPIASRDGTWPAPSTVIGCGSPTCQARSAPALFTQNSHCPSADQTRPREVPCTDDSTAD